MTNLNSILKSRDIILPTKVHLVKAMVFPVVRYGYESWTIKKAEHWRIDAFELWCWRRLLRVPWTLRRSNQSIWKEISPDYSLERLMLKLKLQYFSAIWCKEPTHWKRSWCWERLKAGGEGGDRGWDGWMASPTRQTWVWASSESWWRTGKPGLLKYMGSQSWTWLSDWTGLTDGIQRGKKNLPLENEPPVFLNTGFIFNKMWACWDLPGGPVVKTSLLNAGGAGSIPGQGSKIPQALRPKQQQERKKKKNHNGKSM